MTEIGTELERLAKLEVNQQRMREDIHDIRSDLKAIRETLSEARGGWKLLMMASGIAGTVGVIVGKFIMFSNLMR
jgi:hypothetical protein